MTTPMLLHQSLPGGVRLRLPHRTDLPSVQELCARHDHECDVEALLRFDPRDRAVICAVAWRGDGDVVVGLGTIAVHAGAQPDLLIADGEELRDHLREALLARVANRPRRAPRRSRGVRAFRAVTRRRAA
jgi:hypothetical protein